MGVSYVGTQGRAADEAYRRQQAEKYGYEYDDGSAPDRSRMHGVSANISGASINRMPGIVDSSADYDNGMGGIFGEREEEASGLSVDALGLARQAATGQTPSAAEILGQQGLDRAAADQMSMAASARGPAALAAAQRNAAYNSANLQQQGAAQMAAMRANEMAGARQQYMQGTQGYQGLAQGRLGLAQGLATSQAGLEAQNQAGAASYRLGAANTGQGVMNFGRQIGVDAYRGDVASAEAQQAYQQNAMNAAKEQADRQQAARGGLLRSVGAAIPGAVNTAVGAMSGGGAGTNYSGGGADKQAGSTNTSSAKQVGNSANQQSADNTDPNKR